jgi:hypothetical protein
VPGYLRIVTRAQALALAREVLDPERQLPVVIVSTPADQPRPLLRVAELTARVAPVPVRLLAGAWVAHRFAEFVPPEVAVSGGAVRICLPASQSGQRVRRHPLMLIRDEADAERALTTLARLAERAVLERPPYPVGSVVRGEVRDAEPGGLEVVIATGWSGWLVRRRREAGLVVGDPVLVRVVGYDRNRVVLQSARPDR